MHQKTEKKNARAERKRNCFTSTSFWINPTFLKTHWLERNNAQLVAKTTRGKQPNWSTHPASTPANRQGSCSPSCSYQAMTDRLHGGLEPLCYVVRFVARITPYMRRCSSVNVSSPIISLTTRIGMLFRNPEWHTFREEDWMWSYTAHTSRTHMNPYAILTQEHIW